jgi:transposase
LSVLRVVGLAVAAMLKGAMDVMVTGTEGSATVNGVVLGVDTHLDLHVAVVLDQLGRRLGDLTVPTTKKGYESLLAWAESFGPIRCAGVEGTSSYGAGLARYLRAMVVPVMEIERPKRRHLRRKGKGRTLSMPRSLLGRCSPARRRAYPRAQTGAWR